MKEEIKISDREKICLKAMGEILLHSDDGMCTYFRFIAEHAKLPINKTRQAVRALVRKGLAEYHKGLFNDDGMVAGSGHCLTRKGEEIINRLWPEL